MRATASRRNLALILTITTLTTLTTAAKLTLPSDITTFEPSCYTSKDSAGLSITTAKLSIQQFCASFPLPHMAYVDTFLADADITAQGNATTQMLDFSPADCAKSLMLTVEGCKSKDDERMTLGGGVYVTPEGDKSKFYWKYYPVSREVEVARDANGKDKGETTKQT